MNLLSCTECASVFDKDLIRFPVNFELEDGCIDFTKATWNGDDFVAFINCPVCDGIIEDR